KAQIMALENEGFSFTDDGMQLDLSGRILFDLNSSDVDLDTRHRIKKITTMFLEIGIDRIRLDGHTDDTGDARYNEALSKRRADAVAQLMVEDGYPANAIQTRGLGSQKPVARNNSSEGRASNRRVTVIVGAME
ncbi:OmpA family protein, partial [Lampropedia puyangensis]